MFYVSEWPWVLIICLCWSRWSDVWRFRKAIRIYFLHLKHLKKTTCRMALGSHNPLTEHLKIRLWWCRLSDVSWCGKGIPTHFQHCWHSKKRFGLSRGSDVWSSRMALRTHKLPSWHLRTRLWWSGGIVFSRCRKALWTHFVHSEHWKKLGWSRLCDVLCTRMASRTHNLSSERLKIRLCWFRWIVVSWCWMAIRKLFLHSVNSKKRCGQIRWSDFFMKAKGP
jgi:hypothetical protein